ncbi:transcription initiation factor IID, 18kD subunit-domain-containing protein [Suillus subaureus]|uniref:Transcription initiation factor TFIID subunit 13 n=1 Tax=Suillus subaureus TaxID=48587 RepID=A0A9P7ENX3_9AGAM|nr:transcription initiation factor IID, 18kD subunit-domain-containing protein [Suillus subaureus]KAG1827250.1 transcription initiation factor IID, 18kD subunit-domain-containing protein [Suillus subaureus]
MFMSYSHYQPGQHPAGTTYPYYHPGAPGAYAHPQTPGYPAYHQGYATGVTGYGAWPYPYTYIPQQPAQAPSQQAVRPTVQTTAPPAATPIPTPVAATPKTTTFTSYTPTYARETAPAATAGRYWASQISPVKNLMYGFGDDRNPANDTVNVMEEILVEFIADICQTAGGPQRKTRLSIEDLRRALSRLADAKKLARMEELLFMQEDIKRARAQFEESDITQSKEY